MSYPANFTMLKRGYGVTDAAHTVEKYPIGATFTDEKGNVFEYVKTASAVSIGVSEAVILLAAGAQSVTTTLAAATGSRIGVAMVAVTAITSTVQYLWVQTKTGAGQVGSISVAASCAAYAGLGTTATAGVLDDAVSIGKVYGITINTAVTSAAVSTNAIISFPYVFPAFASS